MAQESWNRDKEETGCKIPEGLIVCANNCGLLGSPATMNLCSNCYRDLVQRNPADSILRPAGGSQVPHDESQSPSPSPSTAPAAAVAPAVGLISSAPSSSSFALQSERPAEPRQTNRCTACRKRVGLTGFRCRCGHMFCGIHRYSDKHGCTFDYKAVGREAIAKANPVVKADKVIRF